MKKITKELTKYISKDVVDYIILDYYYDYKNDYNEVINEIKGELYPCHSCNRYTLEHYWCDHLPPICPECYENKKFNLLSFTRRDHWRRSRCAPGLQRPGAKPVCVELHHRRHL